MGTYATFVAALQAMTVTGVTRHYDEPPGSVNTADLPAAFPFMPNGGLGERTMTCRANDKTRAMQYVIAIEPVGQGTQAQNYGTLAALMDALETALDGLEVSQGGTLTNFVEYDMRAEIVVINSTDYWGVVAEVRTRER